MSDITDQLAGEIYKDLHVRVNVFLKNIAEEIRNDLANMAVSEVYGAYDPEIYERRYTLDKIGSYEVTTGDLSISITPIAEFNRAYGGWNYGNELGGFMNFGNYWHGYVMNYSVPMPRPYISNTAEEWNYDKIQSRLKEEFGEWADVINVSIQMGE